MLYKKKMKIHIMNQMKNHKIKYKISKEKFIVLDEYVKLINIIVLLYIPINS